MQRTKQKKKEWKRYKEVSVPWDAYDAYRLGECQRVLNLGGVFRELDKPVQRREFKLSSLTVLLLFKILFGIGYRGIASAAKDLKIYQMLGMKRAPCYKTIQNTMQYLDARFLGTINRIFVPKKTKLAGIDSSGLKTHRKGAWVIVRFQCHQRKRDFKKVHIFVDLVSKKIIHCFVTKGTASDSKQLKKILKQCTWIKVEIILGDTGYDTRECFTEVKKFGAEPGIPVRKNASTKARGCPSRRKAVRAQRKDFDGWSKKVHRTMRCVVEAIFSGTKRRFGEYFFSIKNRFRKVEMWLRTILWNVLIYPR
jgi:transposase